MWSTAELRIGSLSLREMYKRSTMAAANTRIEGAGIAIAEAAVQLHGAIGLTDEYIVGHYYKRLTANRLLAGAGDEHLVQFREQSLKR